MHSLYVKVKTLLSLVNLRKFGNFEENKFEQMKEKNSNATYVILKTSDKKNVESFDRTKS